jgi:hypothetical protein
LSKIFIHHLGDRKVYQEEVEKSGGCHLTKNGDVIARKPTTLFKQIARHRMEFFEIKSTYPSDFLKNITTLL